jgi:hypothetical protein
VQLLRGVDRVCRFSLRVLDCAKVRTRASNIYSPETGLIAQIVSVLALCLHPLLHRGKKVYTSIFEGNLHKRF